jgi:hypothetical protein
MGLPSEGVLALEEPTSDVASTASCDGPAAEAAPTGGAASPPRRSVNAG